MSRPANHVAPGVKRKKVLRLTRDYLGVRKNVWTVTRNTWKKGPTYMFRDYRSKKGNFRVLWTQRTNAAVRLKGVSHSELIDDLHEAGIEINRKILADLVINYPEAFKAIVAKTKVI